MKDINRKIVKGASWMVLLKLVERSIGFICTLILVRLLVPADFGLIAMGMSIVAFLELLSAFGFDVALIQNQQADRRHYDTAWTLDLMFACVGGAGLVAAAGLAAEFYNEPRLQTVMYVLAIGFVIEGFQNIGIVAFRKEMEFGKEFMFLFSKKISSVLVTVPLAFIWQNYWALLVGILAGKLVGVALSYHVHPFRPRFTLTETRHLIHFSKWLVVNNIIFFLQHRSGDFVIGKLAGPQALGLYSIANEISSMPTTELVAPINRAVFPGYAKMSSDLHVLRQGFLNVIAVIALGAVPAGAGIAATADLFVPVLLGDKWIDTISLMQILAVSGIFVALQTNTGSVYFALGKPRILTFLFGSRTALFIPAIIWLTSEYGPVGAAWSVFGTTLLILPVNYLVLFRLLNISVGHFAAVIWRPIIAVVLMVVVVRLGVLSEIQLVGMSDQIVGLGLAITIGAASYAIAVLGLWRLSDCPQGAEQVILDNLLPRLRGMATWAFPK